MNSELINNTTETELHNEKKNAITIIVCDQDEKGLCDTLETRYADAEWIDVIPYGDYDAATKSEMYILVGALWDSDENVKKLDGVVINLSDSIIKELSDSDISLSSVRNQLLDGITLSKDTMVGIDFQDLMDVLQNRNNISVGFVSSKVTSEAKTVITQLIAKTKVDVEKCKSAYFYVDGDIGLMEVNELVAELATLLGDEDYIAFTASYNPIKSEEYYAMILIAE